MSSISLHPLRADRLVPMKYFTRPWATGELTDEEFEETFRAYRSHVEGLVGHLPGAVAELATSISLHDGIIRRVSVDRRAAGLRIELRCGDQQVGYFDAVLQYLGVPLEETDLDSLEDRARDPRTRVLYDEVDIDGDGRLCHRFLFWPDGELEIRFTSFALARVKRDRRVEPRSEDVYSESVGVHATNSKVFERTPLVPLIMRLLFCRRRGRAMRYWLKTCPTCSQGRLFIMRMNDAGNLYLHCEECESIWPDPARADDPTQGELGIDFDSEYASEQEIQEGGWQPYALNATAE
jgi:hypothetical protein